MDKTLTQVKIRKKGVGSFLCSRVLCDRTRKKETTRTDGEIETDGSREKERSVDTVRSRLRERPRVAETEARRDRGAAGDSLCCRFCCEGSHRCRRWGLAVVAEFDGDGAEIGYSDLKDDDFNHENSQFLPWSKI